MMDRDQIAEHLAADVADARAKIKRALLKWENSRRRDAHQPELPASTEVWLPGAAADLHLLTFALWSTKYCVNMEWLIDAVLTRLGYRRRLPHVTSSESLSIGLPAAVLIGEDARRAVLEKLARDFPNRENVLSHSQTPAPPMPDLTDDNDDFITSYREALTELAKNKKTDKPVRAYRSVV